MAHALAGRCGGAGDEPGHRLVHVLGDPLRGLFLGGPADLADHDHAFGRVIVVEHREAIDEVGAVHRISTDADGGGLTEPGERQLMNRFVGEGAGAADDADLAGLVDIARHDPDLAAVGELRVGSVA